MALTVRRVVLWRGEVDNTPGALARSLEPLAAAGADLGVVMAYAYPGNSSRAAVEVHPVAGKKAQAAARQAGLQPASTPTLLVAGDNRAGLGASVSRAVADAGINMQFLVAQVAGRKYSYVVGFGSEEDATRAAAVIRKASRRR